MMSLLWEKAYPWVAAGIALVALGMAHAMGWWEPHFPDKGNSKFLLLGSSVTGSASFTAFLLTTLSFLLGVDSPAAKQVFKSKYRDVLLSYFKAAIYGWIAFCLSSLAGYYLYACVWYFYVWITLLVFSVFAFVRCARLLFLLLRDRQTN